MAAAPDRMRFAVGAALGRRNGFSLLELLLVVALISVFSAMLLSQLQPTVASSLQATAEIVAADLDYARGLAVANDSRYCIEFDSVNGRYTLFHAGSNAALDSLPRGPMKAPADGELRHSQRLAALPIPGVKSELVGVEQMTAPGGGETSGSLLAMAAKIEFGPLGELTDGQETTIWLSCGRNSDRRFVPVRVDPVTGLATIGELRTAISTPTPAAVTAP